MGLVGSLKTVLELDNDPAHYLRLNLMLMRFMGMLHSADVPLRRLHALAVYVVLVLHGLSGVVDLYHYPTVSAVTVNLPVTTLALGSSHRLYLYTKHANKYKAVIDAVATHFLPSSSTGGLQMSTWLRQSRAISLLYVGYGGLLSMTWQLQPVIKYLLLSQTHPNGTATPLTWDDMEFPSRVVYPFEAKQPGVYQLVFLFQGVAIFFSGTMILVTDSMFITLALLISGQFEILKDTLRNVREIATERVLSKHRELEKTDNPLEAREEVVTREINSVLGKCIQHHNLLLRMIKDLDDLHWPAYTVNFTCLLIILSFNAFDLSSPNPDSDYYIRAVYQVGYMIAAMVQMYLLCQCGDKLLQQISDRIIEITKLDTQLSINLKTVNRFQHEESVSAAAYESRWYDCSETVKRTLRIIVLRTKKIEPITIGRIAPLNMSVFSDMLSRSFSYFTVLRQMRDAP